MTPTIEAQGLVKRFGRTTALSGLDLVAEPGQVVAVLGPNGAGKTTFVPLLWAAAIVAVSAPLAVARYRRG